MRGTDLCLDSTYSFVRKQFVRQPDGERIQICPAAEENHVAETSSGSKTSSENLVRRARQHRCCPFWLIELKIYFSIPQVQIEHRLSTQASALTHADFDVLPGRID